MEGRAAGPLGGPARPHGGGGAGGRAGGGRFETWGGGDGDPAAGEGLWRQVWRRGSREALAGLASVAAGAVLWELVRLWQRRSFAKALRRDLDTAGLARVLVVGAHEFDAEAVADVLQDALPGVSPELSVVSAADLPSAEENDSSLAASAWSAVRAEARRRAALALEALEASEANGNGDQKSSSAVGLRLAVGMFWDLLELDPETQMPIVWVEIVDADSGQRGSACQVGAIRARSAGVPPLHAYLRHEAIELAWEQFVSRA